METRGVSLTKYVGREYETYNCFDLVKEFYKDVFNSDLSHFWEGNIVPPKSEIDTLVKTSVGSLTKAETPSEGDIVVLNLFGYSCHIGVVVNKDKVLHSVKSVGSCIEPLSKYKHVIEGFYRLGGT